MENKKKREHLKKRWRNRSRATKGEVSEKFIKLYKKKRKQVKMYVRKLGYF